MSDHVQHVVDQIILLVKAGKTPEEALRQLSLIGVDTSVLESAADAYRREAARIRKMKEPMSIDDGSVEGWYVGRLEDDRFWPAFERYLFEAKGWDADSVKSLDDASTKVISLLRHPGEGTISTRALVVGYVQSGKTANFTAVISKAADVGYRFFLVLSGTTNALRRQTQLRLQKEITDLNEKSWFKLTSDSSDFRENLNVNSLLTERDPHFRVLGVVKKNATVLRKLRKWLGGAHRDVLRSCPVLIIDDEADQASPNAAADPEERTRINELIVELLGTLPKAAYVGYTATPFANLLIDPTLPQDLYPRDFIVYLPQPSGYFGPEQLFGRDPINWDAADEGADGLDMIRVVPDSEVVQLKPASAAERFSFTPSVTSSLETAIRYFWLATAARRARGQHRQHSTMLVHTSQYEAVHNSFAGPVATYQAALLLRLERGDHVLEHELQSLWDEEISRLPAESFGHDRTPFEFLRVHLEEVIQATQVKVENGRATDRIDYEEPGKIYLVVGGNVLSRGLTLEGLLVSLYVRTASAYDTLLQMGRWFGFRPGYEDLPRIWMTEELKGYFHDLATVEKEIRYDIARYATGLYKPVDFGVRIRTHPQLAITSKLKMQHAVDAEMSFSATAQQTRFFRHRDPAWLMENRDAAVRLISAIRAKGLLSQHPGERPHPIFNGVPVNLILDFLDAYKFHEAHDQLRTNLLKGYISAQNTRGKLITWNVGVVTRNDIDETLGLIDLGLAEPLAMVNRARVERPDQNTADIKALMSAVDDGLDLAMDSKELEALGREKVRAERDRRMPDTGLLLLYPISKASRPLGAKAGSAVKRVKLDAAEDVVGLALVFPKADEITPQNYKTVDLSAVEREEMEPIEEEEVVA